MSEQNILVYQVQHSHTLHTHCLYRPKVCRQRTGI